MEKEHLNRERANCPLTWNDAAFTEWKRQAVIQDELASEWGDYSALMTAYHDALQRAPHTAQACARVDIVALLISEFEHLANVVNAMFPGGMREFASYITDTQKAEND